MRAGRAHVDILVRGARTWLLQARQPPTSCCYGLGPCGWIPDSLRFPKVTASPPWQANPGTKNELTYSTRAMLRQAPSEATYSTLHPDDATRSAPWPWEKETLTACDQVTT